ncbi:hypothetical protein Sfulv_60770 [Streptomyces fulvorobeus]|uniref:Uncharacterized protein n=1 Tax=Streptomyces fulvorobeus TaxID=284028 RepID=A0A7J0CHR1_9ACTN|nr:hypothetical protein [Streptomyces fulvorobeus]GFN01267.1 hypothetical protein Sfulv_60770 [Streptomyces fulvorobeus]
MTQSSARPQGGAKFPASAENALSDTAVATSPKIPLPYGSGPPTVPVNGAAVRLCLAN